MSTAFATTGNPLEPTISKGQQDVDYQELLILNGQRLRIDIRSNFYDFQCSARIDRWDGNQWHQVWHLDPGTMMTATGLAYRSRPIRADDFADDRNELVEHAMAVLG